VPLDGKNKNATDFLARPAATTKRERGISIEYVGTALQSRPARAIIALKIRTGLETRPHMFYQFAEEARNCAFVITDYRGAQIRGIRSIHGVCFGSHFSPAARIV
jgi:hypothetical protein